MLGIAAAVAGASCGNSNSNSSAGETDGAHPPVVLAFEDDVDLLQGFEYDTGFLPQGGPAAIRILATATAGFSVAAEGTSSGPELDPVAGSGTLQVDANLALEVSARVEAGGLDWEGVVDTFEYGVDPQTATFDPFLLGESTTVTTALPPVELARAPIGAVPGATLIVSIEGGSIDTTFSGVCATVQDQVAQYTGMAAVEGVVEVAGTLEIELLALGTEVFGPFSFPVPIPATTTPLDLGSFSTLDGAPSNAMPCADASTSTTGGGNSEGDTLDSDAVGDATGATEDGDGGGEVGGATDSGPSESCLETCDGCCRGEECLNGLSSLGCGFQEVCEECPQGTTCNGFDCVDEPDCLSTCDGCCSNGQCFGGFDLDACGFQETCESCAPGATCDGFDCIPASAACLETCAGCCVGDVCNVGDEDDACGSGGACADCGFNAACASGVCIPAQWTLTLVSGVVFVDGLESFGGEPDPYLRLTSAGPGLELAVSETISNTSTPTWNEVLASDVALTNPFFASLWDEDGLTADDLIGACSFSFPPAAFGGTHEVTCEVDGELAWTAVFEIEGP